MSTNANNSQMTTSNDNEVARLREDKNTWRDEANAWHQHYRDEASKTQKCKQAFIEQEKEVARLREFLNRAIEICEHRDCTSSVSELRDEIQKLKKK